MSLVSKSKTGVVTALSVLNHMLSGITPEAEKIKFAVSIAKLKEKICLGYLLFSRLVSEKRMKKNKIEIKDEDYTSIKDTAYTFGLLIRKNTISKNKIYPCFMLLFNDVDSMGQMDMEDFNKFLTEIRGVRFIISTDVTSAPTKFCQLTEFLKANEGKKDKKFNLVSPINVHASINKVLITLSESCGSISTAALAHEVNPLMYKETILYFADKCRLSSGTGYSLIPILKDCDLKMNEKKLFVGNKDNLEKLLDKLEEYHPKVVTKANDIDKSVYAVKLNSSYKNVVMEMRPNGLVVYKDAGKVIDVFNGENLPWQNRLNLLTNEDNVIIASIMQTSVDDMKCNPGMYYYEDDDEMKWLNVGKRNKRKLESGEDKLPKKKKLMSNEFVNSDAEDCSEDESPNDSMVEVVSENKDSTEVDTENKDSTEVVTESQRESSEITEVIGSEEDKVADEDSSEDDSS